MLHESILILKLLYPYGSYGLLTKTFNMRNKLFFIIFFSLFAFEFAIAGDQTVEMLNRLNKESMVFEPKIVRVNVGDTVLWKATDKGHNF